MSLKKLFQILPGVQIVLGVGLVLLAGLMFETQIPALGLLVLVMLGVQGLTFSISQRMIAHHLRQEEMLRENDELHSAILQTAPDGIWVVDGQGRLLEVNERYCEMSGYSAQELLTLRISDLESIETDAEIAARLQNLTAKGEDHFESRHRRKDGTTFDVEVSLRYRSTGVGQCVAFFHDISRRKQSDERLKALLEESNHTRVVVLGVLEDELRTKTELKRLATAIEQASEGIVITDSRGRIQYVNPSFETMTGFSREEALGQTPGILKSGEQDRAFYRLLWETISKGKIWNGRFINRKKSGALYTEEATISPVHDATGKIVNYVAVKRDMTGVIDLQAQLAQAQKMDAVGRLAGGVAHDFNNLLMGIMGYAELCRDTVPGDHPARCYLDEIISMSQRSGNLTRQLLAFARRQIIAPKVLDLNDTMMGMCKLLQQMIGEDINMVWMAGANLWKVKLDPTQVDQILANLCVNARDAIAGVGRVTVETANVALDQAYCASREGANPGDYVCLAVSDSGCGMTPEVRERIFEPFFTTKGVGQGTGLGLATVYGIVKQNNGFIDVISEPGLGTTFKIYFPRVADGDAHAADTREEEVPRGHGEIVLLAEDEPALRRTCSRFLDSLGYKALVAETPEHALELAVSEEGKIHLLLTDVVMPGMNGRELADRISAIKPGIKVLYMSGYSVDVIAQRSVLSDGVFFIQKPYTRNDLARKIHEVFGQEQEPTISGP